jgi:hypothetical protein
MPLPSQPPKTVHFDAVDGRSLTGSLFVPDGPPHATLLVNSGTGIPRRFYARFAAHAADRGVAALTYDYRGVGDSAPASLRDDDARYRDWGQQDIPGAIDWLTRRFPGGPLYAVGHSTGGQQLGLAPNVNRVRDGGPPSCARARSVHTVAQPSGRDRAGNGRGATGGGWGAPSHSWGKRSAQRPERTAGKLGSMPVEHKKHQPPGPRPGRIPPAWHPRAGAHVEGACRPR